MIPAAADLEIRSSRIVNAAREHVFSAWTDPMHLKNWWGPSGFTNTFNEFDLRPGGRWSFVMHGPDKGAYANECEFTEIDPPARLAWKRFTKPLFDVVALFEELSPSQTNIVFRQIFDSAAACNKVKTFAAGRNEEMFDRLEMELKQMRS